MKCTMHQLFVDLLLCSPTAADSWSASWTVAVSSSLAGAVIMVNVQQPTGTNACGLLL